ncbi:MAG: hypothetical protein IV090_19950 [Candidatus Sericytochromatia bacterium]|nr:hypothetical protein [Candidatus Sericytochromatia bacterium]
MLPQRLAEIETALSQSEPPKDPRVKQALYALKLLTAEVRSQNLDFRLLRCLCATAYRLMELDFKRIESYLTLVWLFSVLREYSRAWQILLHAERVVPKHPAIQAGFESIQVLLKKPSNFQPVDMDAVAISFQFSAEGPAAELGSEDALAWNTLFPLLKQVLAEAEHTTLQARWQAMQSAYHPLQAQVLQVLRTAQEGSEHA